MSDLQRATKAAPQPPNYAYMPNGLYVYARNVGAVWYVYQCDRAGDKAGRLLSIETQGDFERLFFPLPPGM